MSRYILLLLTAFAMLNITTASYGICPLNEVWNECGTACPLTCEDREPKNCTLQCVRGCECKPGWLRNKWKICVPEKWCPTERHRTCPLNEVWDECGTACPLTCEDQEPRDCTLQCVKGCQCKPGWLRNKLGICVPEKWCPPKGHGTCPLNEVWNECGTACPLTCEDQEPKDCTLQCVRGCECKPGWLRNKLGICVPEKWCPRKGNGTCPRDEVWNECGTACPLTCENPEPTPCTLQCVRGCECKPGLLRNQSGICVPEESCLPEGQGTCPLNEVWNECGTACPFTCEDREPKPCTLQCVRGCQCKPGWLRNKVGVCVPEEWCPAEGHGTCPRNEVWEECGTACPLTCENPEPRPCTKQCVRGCQCKPGLLRNQSGICVPEESCPANDHESCPRNAVWNECGTACPLTCEDQRPRACTMQCVKGCQCKPGWLRNKLGICVPEEWCRPEGPGTCPRDEVWKECGTACPLTCEDREPRNCTLQCVRGCQCKPGLLRNQSGICVPEKSCPPEGHRTCPLNEVWNDCGTACPLTCEDRGPKPCTLQCVRGCQCKPGWLRNKLGVCVPEEWCPSEGPGTCPRNEVWKECGSACPLTCENPEPRPCTKQCVRGCQCKPGLLRNQSGICVPEKSCPPEGPETCPRNEVWNECGTACPLTCENPEPRPCTKQCVRGCQCKPGLLRNQSGICIPEKSCPPEGPGTCPRGEVWNECGTACPLTCENPEPRPCTKQCVRGCQCKPGLLRNQSGICVPETSCPPEGPGTCPRDEVWNECGTACPLTCEDRGPKPCTLQCVRGCECKPGWLRNKLGICVPEERCPPAGHETCPRNEIWYECGTACPLTCQNPEPRPCTLQCVKGCQCRPGLLRNKFGLCVPRKWCCG